MLIESLDKPINFLLYGINKPVIILKMRIIQLIMTLLIVFLFSEGYLELVYAITVSLLLSKGIYIRYFYSLFNKPYN